ncbi:MULTISPECIES: diguanylate cyclase [Modicisalibacter]|uniref:diguanylate cyclase domain-containing protein n=1 Tax=Modicisalibacter TaxID=574347 RepID=UPI00100B7343|nr:MULTISPECIES: diguanylate cyclase [Halomonadaceae]MBZ9560333.1 diguanylate cyclase [Modicisalibacter sp. R2A 31.J]MBZ9576242.1 diguanylate cyclase [Modicisalibacter sp. MOD 31.J]
MALANSRWHDRLFFIVYLSALLLIAGHALWHYLMGHYDDILLPALLAMLLAGALFVRLVNPGFRRLLTYSALISCYLLIAVDLARHETHSLIWLGAPPVATFLLLPLAPALLLNLFLAPVWLLLIVSALPLWHATLVYLALVGLTALPAWLIHSRHWHLRAGETRDPQCQALSRQALHSRLAAEVERSRALKCPLEVLVIHLPQLEMADEQFGGALLHALLTRACLTIQANCRQHDLLGRAQTSLFWLLLPDTGEAGTLIVRERLLHALSREVFAETGPIQSRIRSCPLLPGETPEHFEQRLMTTGLKLMEPTP